MSYTVSLLTRAVSTVTWFQNEMTDKATGLFSILFTSYERSYYKVLFSLFPKKIIDFLDELRLFIEEKPNEKKNTVTLPLCPEKFGSPLLPFPFNLETSSFGLVNDPVDFWTSETNSVG
jgi:hypothetical protein